VKILFITLSNIGDVILTLPALDYLLENFPGSKVTCIAGPRAAELFGDNPAIERLIIYDKHSSLREKIRLFFELKKEGFQSVVDFRNSFFGALLPARYKIPLFAFLSGKPVHMKERNLFLVKKAMAGAIGNNPVQKQPRRFFFTDTAGCGDVDQILKAGAAGGRDKIVVISAGARSHIKRWSADKYSQLAAGLAESLDAKILLVGDKDDIAVSKYIRENSKHPLIDLTGRTSLSQLACLLKMANLLVTNDSAVLHLASYLDVPLVSLFGPTNDARYGPWSKNSRVVKKEIFCRPCNKAQCRFATLACMQLINTEDVLQAVSSVIAASLGKKTAVAETELDYRRILVVRTDRIGDVILSTPVIKALRKALPCAYIAMMVSEYAKDIVDGNPYLDEVIVYDKEARHKGWFSSFRFSAELKKKRFDLAIILHPTNRAHIVTFLAGISRRIGYDRKMGFLLTDRLKHEKHLGQKHEAEYNLDFMRFLGIEPLDTELFMPIKKESETWLEELFKKEKIDTRRKLLVFHPGASCPSKIWPWQSFADLMDKLADKYGAYVFLVASQKDRHIAKAISARMHAKVINLSGLTTLSQMASLLKRCSLFISNDSGPVHIASALGAPVISIFGRKQPGLSPRRWGPLGLRDAFIHKDAGCIECLAHNCQRQFACLRIITVDDVLKAADEILAA